MADDPKTNPLRAFGWAPGNYLCVCFDCEKQHVADKRARRCEPCAEKMAEAYAD